MAPFDYEAVSAPCQQRLYLAYRADVYLAEAQLAKIRAWAESSPYVDAVRLFGSYAKGNAHERSDIDLAVSANAGHYLALVDESEHNLSDILGSTVHIRDFLRNEATQLACDECSLLLFPQSA